MCLQSGDDPGIPKKGWSGWAGEVVQSPITIVAVIGGSSVAITKAVDNLDKDQALLKLSTSKDLDLLSKDQALLKLSTSKDLDLLRKDQDLLRKDVEVSHLQSQLELNTTLTSKGYGAEYIEWRKNEKKTRAKEGVNIAVWIQGFQGLFCSLWGRQGLRAIHFVDGSPLHPNSNFVTGAAALDRAKVREEKKNLKKEEHPL